MGHRLKNTGKLQKLWVLQEFGEEVTMVIQDISTNHQQTCQFPSNFQGL